ncbi:CobW family GTP-binding protein [Thaumasiovibrio subtropicus]|uniref:CobW family GTP-binding protein n=1 Tax=Thaumasiovibrio subtropicus TaxID=1891207 RepID=UPI000B35640C|nr:GTP-binding protein [Thaumasiovibrio subtropicus]
MNKIPTNIITGFLGSGKTTAILDLLSKKPKNENWAVLVNEFGQVGIDGAFLSEQGALIKEVPGGCMCCVAGLPMSVGLNALIEQTPDRIILEPTGLGHPQKILDKLRSDSFSNYLDMRATIALVDPRNLGDTQYTSNDNFQAQLALADIIVGNKADLCDETLREAFEDQIKPLTDRPQVIALTEQGILNPAWLELEAKSREVRSGHHHHHDHEIAPLVIPENQQYIRKENHGQGFRSCGWCFTEQLEFDFSKLFTLFSQLSAQRIKAVVKTQNGYMAFNVVNQVVSVNELSLMDFESRIEVIDREMLPWEELETYLIACLTTPIDKAL